MRKMIFSAALIGLAACGAKEEAKVDSTAAVVVDSTKVDTAKVDTTAHTDSVVAK